MISFPEQSLLPAHPSSSVDYSRLTLQTNQYRVSIPDHSKIYMYTVSFSPSIPSDNTRLKKHLIRSSRPEINRYLDKFIHCGENLFSLKDMFPEIQTSSSLEEDSHNSDTAVSSDTEEINSVSVDCTFQASVYSVRIQCSGSIDSKETETKSSGSLMQFYNILLRDKLKFLKLVQIGSNRDHFDPLAAKRIQGFPACVWPGYFTSINALRGGLLLTIDSSFKLVRNDTVLDVIREVYKKYGQNCREHIRKELRNAMVMTFYGAQQMYRIEEVLFEETPEDTFLQAGQEVTYERYFRNRYQAEISSRNQPLLLARRGCRAEPVRLIPELCRMTGAASLHDDNRLKKEVSVHTRLRPEKRQQEIQGLAERLCGVNSTYWNMENSRQALSVQALQLPHPQIITGSKKIQLNDRASFKMIDTPLLSSVALDRWQLFCTERDLPISQDLTTSLQHMGRSYSVSVKSPIIVPVAWSKNMESSFAQSLRDKVHVNAQLVVVLLPRPLSYLYASIKQILTAEKPVPSQVILTSSVERRDLSVFSKILTQIACKIGAGPWGITLPPSLPAGTMLVGIDVCHNSFHAKQSVLGFCASLDPGFTKYFTKIAFHEPNQEISSVLTPLFLEALKQYYLNNRKQKPECIVLYRDGVGTSQYSQVVDHEIPQMIAAIREFDRSWKPQVVAVVVNKRVNQRFYLNSGNPHAGIVVDSEVVWEHYNFYLMSHNVNAGSMTPTHYNVVVNDSGMGCKCLYELTYNLCFMYYNWQGGIRVPAPCMYAHKIAYLVGKHTGMNFNGKLANTYFYL